VARVCPFYQGASRMSTPPDESESFPAVEFGPAIAVPSESIAVPAAKTGAMLLSLLVVHGLVDLYSGVWPIFKHHAGISLETAGLIATVAPIFSWSLQPLFGMWADRGHLRTCILWGVALSFPMMLLGPMSHPGTPYSTAAYVVMFLIVFLSRMGQAVFHPAAATVAGDLARGAGRSGMVALFVATGWIGYSLNQWIFSYTYVHYDQQTQWLLVPGGLLLLWAWFVCRPTEHHAAKSHRYRDALETLRAERHRILPVFFTLSFMSCVEQGVTFLLPEFSEARGCPPWAVNGGALVCFVAGTVTFMIPAGFLADRVGRKRVLGGSIAACLLVYLLMVLVPSVALPAFFALLFASGGMINAAGPLGVSIAQHLVHAHKSLVTGVMMGLTWTLGGVAPLIVGLLTPRYGMDAALLSLAGFNLLALVSVCFVPKEDA
jgi:MFS family permease